LMVRVTHAGPEFERDGRKRPRFAWFMHLG
jgi:hypothetical protein